MSTVRRKHRHSETAYIYINTRECAACGDCIKICSRNVLGMISFLWHRHVRVANAENCVGCKRCLKTCKQKAISAFEAE
jgi:NAD-dependent dihydropyrimidine dehydrogenase PreA subunit